MLIDPGMIADRFEQNLEWAKRLDLVSAWATEHDGLRLLEERAKQGLRVRAIVGLWNYITEPEALRRLDRLGKLRLASGGRPFHPKVYLFRGKSRTVAWVGSANFTAGGFAINEEAVFESEDTDSVKPWLKNLWRECGRLDENAIDEYERARENNPPPRRPLAEAGGPVMSPMALLQQVTDWDSYVAALRKCDVWWSNRQRSSVLGEPVSWRHTIEVLRDILTLDIVGRDVPWQDRQPPLRHRRHGLDQPRRDTAFRYQEPQIHAHRACQPPGVALRPGLHTVEQHPPDQCRVIGPRIVSKARQHLCDQSDLLTYGLRADRAMVFKPVC